MANEFIARKGLIALADSQITGSLNISQNIVAAGTVQATFASNTGTAISGAFDAASSSLATRITSQENFSSSLDNTFATDADLNLVSSSVDSLNAATSSYLQNTTDTLTGDLTVTGTLTAQDLHVQEVTSSIVYSSGSNIFGENVSDTQKFTGSLQVSGSIDLQAGDATFAGSVTSPNFIISDGTDNYIQFDLNGRNSHFTNQSKSFIFSGQGASGDYLAGTLNFQSRSSIDRDINFITGATPAKRLTISGLGNVGIGTSSPSSRLQVKDSQDSSFDSGIGIIRSASSQTGYINMVGGAFNFNAPSGVPIRFRDGGTVNVTIDSSGNVGIGTTSPSKKLHVNEPTANTACYIKVNSASWNAGLELSNGNGTWEILNDYTGLGTTGALAFYNSGYRMTILNNGNVGIGTTSPSTVLDVRNSINIGGAGQDSNIYFQQNTSNQARINYYTDNSMIFDNWSGGYYFRTTSSFTPRVTILNGGSVGIGTTSPGNTLHVNSGTTNVVAQFESTDSTGGIMLKDSTGNVELTTSGTNGFNIQPGGGSTVFRVDGDGKVGISSTSPSARLELGAGGFTLKGSRGLYSSSYTSDGLFNANATPNFIAVSGYPSTYSKFSGQSGLILGYADNGAGLYSPAYGFEVKSTDGIPVAGRVVDALVMHDVDTDAKPWTVKNNGSTFISNSDPELVLTRSNNSTSPAARLSFATSQGTVRWQVATNQAVGTGLEINQGNASNNRVYIDTNGNVGIGTTSPTAKLHVNGGGINLDQGGQLTERTTGIEASAAQNTWYTVHTFNQYELTLFFLLVGFEDNLGDSNNRTAVFVDSGSSSYGSGFAPTRLSGSTSIEAQRSGQALQIRFTHTAGGSNRHLRWSLITVTGD